MECKCGRENGGGGTGGELEGREGSVREKGGGGEARVSQPITRQSLPTSLARAELVKM